MANTDMKKRAFIIVLDGTGAGEGKDAAEYGDVGSFTLKSAYNSGRLNVPNMISMGLGNIDGLDFLGKTEVPLAAFGKMAERSIGKDTTTGHWEIAGIIGTEPPKVYPEGFPADMVALIEKAAGREIIVNKPYSGTKVLEDYGADHLKTGKLIVYTSADSVCQIAAHIDLVPVSELHAICTRVREMLKGKYSVGRVIARPFAGEAPKFYRTEDRKDFALEPPYSVLDAIKDAGKDVISVGKISDIFAAKGITKSYPVHGNPDCCDAAMEVLRSDFEGLCFVNLVDTDTEFGHRRDAKGFADCLSAFDRWLGEFVQYMREGDMLIITADHGCDPGFTGTDHTREYVPLLVYGNKLVTADLGVRATFADVAASVSRWLGVSYDGVGTDFVEAILPPFDADALAVTAREAMANAYAPYSMCTVGAALLCDDGTVYTGVNIENAAYSPTICAERSAFVRAINEGKRRFTAIAVCGENTRLRIEGDLFYPCGVCRQFMREFCGEDFKIVVTNARGSRTEIYTLGQLLPHGFGPDNVI
ncbi:MAG: phosphopentomutase [Ruminococcaceae bacterium]|nr:phosphopentomutase [Oscillospiraceae bacterium]